MTTGSAALVGATDGKLAVARLGGRFCNVLRLVYEALSSCSSAGKDPAQMSRSPQHVSRPIGF